MAKQPLMVERTSYLTLLYRKSPALRLLETGLFLAGFALLFLRFSPGSPELLRWSVILALAVLTVTPAMYLLVVMPTYTLYPDRLVVRKGRREEEWPLAEMEKEYGLPFIYTVRGRRVHVMAGNEFLQELNVRLEGIKRGWNHQ
jgi:hypothetical protein